MSEKIKESRKPIALFIICLIVTLLCGGCAQNGHKIMPVQELDTAGAPAADNGQEQGHTPAYQSVPDVAQSAAPQPEQSDSEIVIHVCGAVERPGIYTLPEGSRLWEAVEAAGGVLETGAGNYLNMAAVVTDGEKIVVPFLQDVEDPFGGPQEAASAQTAAAEKKVDLNTADLQQLMTLPGIGEAKAKAILEYREQVGRFSSVEDVKNVPGIKEGAYAKIKDNIEVSR